MSKIVKIRWLAIFMKFFLMRGRCILNLTSSIMSIALALVLNPYVRTKKNRFFGPHKLLLPSQRGDLKTIAPTPTAKPKQALPQPLQ